MKAGGRGGEFRVVSCIGSGSLLNQRERGGGREKKETENSEVHKRCVVVVLFTLAAAR